MALLLSKDGRRSHALALLRDGMIFSAGRDDRLEELAEAFIAVDAWPDAVEALQNAARLSPFEGRIQARLAGLWAQLGEADRANAAAVRARGLGIAVSLDIFAEPTPGLTRQLFNQYARTFDNHLLQTLRYSAPVEIERALRPYAGRFTGRLVIDLGCGTGLMGERFRDAAGRLIGIDLSPGMLEQAAAKGLYDELAEADIVDFLRGLRGGGASLIVAADVLVYMGELRPLFESVWRCLEAEGLFAFTVERLDGNGFALNPARRYSHSGNYLRALAGETGFHALSCQPVVPRLDGGKPVDGLLMLLQKITEPPSMSSKSEQGR